MATGRISKSAVDALTPGGRDAYLWDDEIPGFGVKCTPAGRKVFLVQYKAGGRTRRYTIGAHGALTAEGARKIAGKIDAAIRLEQDPQGEKQAKKAAARRDRAVDVLFEEFLTEMTARKWKPRTAAEYRRLWERFIRPAMGSKKAADIRRIDVTRLHLSLAETPRQADFMLALLSKFFNWCEREEVRPLNSNPVKHVERLHDARGRERFLTAAEMERLGAALATNEARHPQIVALVRLLIFTGCRLNEIVSLRWADVDSENAVLNLPDSKTGKKQVFLPAPASKVLEGLPRIEGNPYVIAGRGEGGRFNGAQKAWQRLRADARLDDVRLHDLRHSYASSGVSGGVPLQIVGKLLGHRDTRTTQIYAHLHDSPVRRAAEKISGQIAASLSGERGAVIAMKRVASRK